MLIERIDFAGFGNVSGEYAHFSRDKISFVVEQNSPGKQMMSTALWAILYDFPKDHGGHNGRLSDKQSCKPKAGSKLPFIAGMDIWFGGRKFKIIRDFSAGLLQVIDLSNKNKDVTKEFCGPNGEDLVGYRLTGMTRELFRSICFVGSKEIADHAFSAANDLTTLFKEPDGDKFVTVSGAPLDAVEETLANFPYRGGRYKIELVIRDLQDRYRHFSERVKQFEEERRGMDADAKRLEDLNHGLVTAEQAELNAFFDLCLEVADIDGRLFKAHETLMKVEELRAELTRLGDLAQFPIDSVKQVEELWTRRASRLSEYNAILNDSGAQIKSYEERESHLLNGNPGLEKLSAEDVASLSTLATRFQALASEVSELRHRRGEESARVQDLGVDLRALEDVRKSLLKLNSRDFEDARSYVSVLTSYRDNISEAEKAIWKAKMVISEIEDLKNAKKGIFALPGGGRKKEQAAAEEEIEKHSRNVEEWKDKNNGLEARLDVLARKGGLADGRELTTHLQAYMAQASNLKELDVIDHSISARDVSLDSLRADLRTIFQKCDRGDDDVTEISVLQLTNDATNFSQKYSELIDTSAGTKQSKQQLDFFKSEVDNVDSLLESAFKHAGVDGDLSVESAYHDFFSKVATYHRWQSLANELKTIWNDMSSGFVPEELPPQIERLESQRAEEWQHIMTLRSKPLIAHSARSLPQALVVKESKPGGAGGANSARRYVDSLRKEKDLLTHYVRTSAIHYDADYMNALAEMDGVEHDLNSVKRAKAALESAKVSLRRLPAQQSPTELASNLNRIAKEFLDNLGLDFDSMSTSTDHKEDESTAGNQASTAHASVSSKEHLRWFARTVISRFFSMTHPLPIILDEPFLTVDDQRFVKLMQFLKERSEHKHQILVLSAHHQRYQWMMAMLDEAQKKQVEICRRTPLTTGATQAR